MYGENSIEKVLPGKVIQHIYMNEDYLKFSTDLGDFTYSVDGDCCSTSYFYDFYGVKNLIGKRVTEVKEVELKVTDIENGEYGSEKDKKSFDDSIQVYGYQITVEDPTFGPVTGVFSFRNYSNGYYGGSLENTTNREVLPEITDDVLVTETNK